MQAIEIAAANFDRHLVHNAYPGRGLVVGRSSVEDAWLMIYWIMGRSEHSRNRRLVIDGEILRTEPVDASLVDDPSLIIYEAIMVLPHCHLIGNGDQIRTIYETLQSGSSFDAALATREREPDAPNYTPRISAMLELHEQPGQLTMNILKANVADPAYTDRTTYRPALPPTGLGLGLTTYDGDGSPLPSFSQDPLLLPCEGDIQAVLNQYWDALDADNRIAIAVKRISANGETSELIVHNRYT
ncbi:MAG: Inosine monophosphate cyclohydrolase [Candidatus Entotheonella factor]|uniref:Inosine monophosphate cyclohydrolase n=1 Tax=Entotheonella factor TaxID=1429438 RepID=W4L4Q3_ENTF1|nr:MAG: Inosine monophosphate cyclohydrolase [Candidatus Entotheonella factor]